MQYELSNWDLLQGTQHSKQYAATLFYENIWRWCLAICEFSNNAAMAATTSQYHSMEGSKKWCLEATEVIHTKTERSFTDGFQSGQVIY